MKKVSLLAASVALALVGCGGSDGGSDTNTGTPSAGGIVITGFDGYFKNAVVFDDMPVATRTSTVGKLDSNDIIFGLTDGNGKITLPKDTEIKGTLSLQTITPNGDVQTMLIARDPNKFAGIYTIDMDHPTQAMAHEVSFRTLPGEKIISPLTDLVAAKAGTNPTQDKIKQAKTEVNTALGLDAENTDVFSDVIAAGDHALHKTAQILTESKVEAGDNYTPTTAIAIAVKATEIVKDPENADKLDQPNFKPTIPVDNSGTVGEVIINNKLVVNKTIYDSLTKQVNSTDKFTNVTEISLIDLPIAELFVDADNKNDITPTVKITTKDSIDVTADFDITKTATELTISAKDSITTVRNIYIVTLSATDIAANNKNMGIVSTTFEIKVELENAAPTLNPQVKSTLQEWLGSLELQQNVAVFNEKMRISELFSDDQDKLIYNAYSSVAGLEFSFPPFLDGGTELEIIGKPSHAYPAGETITISATDGTNTVYEAFTLSAIAKAGITVNEVKYAALQEKIADITLKQNTPVIEAQLNITELFNTESVSGLGAIEYYAGLEDKAPGPNGENLHEGFTTVDGVNVNVDTNGILTISGEPGKVIKGGYFYLMTGINGDAPDAIISEMVKITLPDVKPAEEVIPPTDTKLEDITWYVAEYGTVDGFDSNTGHDQIWCESIKFNNGKVFTNTRSATNLKSCSEANVEWDGATYTVSNAGKTIDVSLPTEKNGEVQIETMRYALTQTEDNISNGSATVYTQEINASDEITYSQRYTFFSEKTDLEARLNIQSNSGWEGRVFPMYLPSASGPKLGTVTLSLEENTNSNDDGSFDADVTFDLPGESITCEMVRDVFRSFTFSNGRDITQTSNGNPFECYNGQDDGSEIQHATVDFDLPNLTVNDVYSILGKTTESGRSQVELIKFNIEWTGVGNNE